MTDSCNATRVNVEYKVSAETDKLFDEFVEKYSIKHNVTKEQAKEHKIVKEVYKCMLEEERDKIHENNSNI